MILLRQLVNFTTWIPDFDSYSTGLLDFYNTRNSEDITTFQSRTETFKFSFLPWSIVEWNKLDLTIRNSSYLVFRNY